MIVFAVFGVLGVAAAVAVAVILFRAERLVRAAAERLAVLACPKCGVAVGTNAAVAARADWQERTKRAHEHARGLSLRLRIDPLWRFRCPACAAALVFEPSGTELVQYDPA